jgi:hypothetical protein
MNRFGCFLNDEQQIIEISLKNIALFLKKLWPHRLRIFVNRRFTQTLFCVIIAVEMKKEV